ncbi:MAG: autotransporter-associated beta strand repeat-containing protein [Planctomycetia bacterium]|nr:autotransporter-associated beta strand repeat-containing protein [Planctomycetia bacterium]
MNQPIRCAAFIVAVLCLLVETTYAATPIWSAFNDFGGANSTINITNISPPTGDNIFGSGLNRAGVANGANTISGTLNKLSDGTSTGTVLTVGGTVNQSNETLGTGGTVGDQLTYFGGIAGLNITGITDTTGGNGSGSTLRLDFTGLNPSAQYSLTLLSDRNTASVRYIRSQIQDVSSFTNVSSTSTKVALSTQSIANDTVAISMGRTDTSGEVIRFTNIRTGADGDFTIFIDAPDPPHGNINNFIQLNVMRLDLDSADAVYWTGAQDSKWTTVGTATACCGTNWSPSLSGTPDAKSLPGTGSKIVFGAASTPTSGTITVEKAFTVDSLNFNSNASGAFTLNTGAAGALTLQSTGNGIQLDSGSGGATINVPITLSNSQTWTNNSTNLLTVAGTVTNTLGTVNSNLTIDGSGNTTISGTIGAGSGTLTKNGAGILTLSGATNTFTGATTVTNGTLVLNYGTSNTTKLSDTAALSMGNATLTFSGGSHAEVVASTTLTSGATSIAQSSGTSKLRMNVITRNVGSTINFGGTGMADTDTNNVNGILGGGLGGYATMTNGGTTDWAMSVAAGAADTAITPFTGYTPFVGSGGTGTANYTATDNNTVTVSEAFNSLKLLTTTSGQSLSLGAQTLTLTSGGLLFTGANDYSITGGTLKGGNTTDLIVHQYASANNLTISSTISNNTGATGLTKTGPGTLTISSTGNNYSGATVIGAGILKLGAAGGVIPDASNVTANGTLDLNGNTETIGSLSGVGTVDTVAGGSPTLTVGSGNGNGTFAGVIKNSAGTLALTKSGTGTEILSGANSSYAGTTTLTTGVLSVSTLANGGSNSSIGKSTNIAANLVLNGGTFQYTGGAASTDRLFTLGGSVSLDASGTGAVNFTNTGSMGGAGVRTLTLTGTNTGDNTLAAAINDSGGAVSLTKTGVGTWVLSNANGYSGTTTISGGTLAYGGNNAIGAGGVTINFGVLDLRTFSDTVGAVTLTNGSIYGSGTLTSNSGYTVNPDSAAMISVNLAGGSALNKSGTSALTITGNNSYTAGTNLAAGWTSFANGSLGSTGNITFTGSSTLQWYGVNTQDISSRLVINNGITATLDTNGNNVTLGTAFGAGGTGLLTKIGAGTLTLSGANTYTGATTVNVGTLRAGVNSAIGSSSAVTVSGNAVGVTATLDLNGSNVTLNNGLTLGGATTSSGALVQTGAGTLTLGSNVTYSSTGNPLGATISGNVNLGTASRTFTVGDSTTVAVDLAVSALVSSGVGGGVTKAGAGLMTLTNGSNSYTGGTSLGAGTLSFANGSLGTTGNITFTAGSTLQWNGTNTQDISSRLIINNGITATLDTNGNNVTLATGFGAGGTGLLTKTGTGTLTLGGANTYTGTTNVSGGSLLITGSLNGTTGTALTFSGGARTANFNEAAGVAQGMGLLTFSSGSDGTVQSTYAGSGTNSLTFSNVAARTAGAAGNFIDSGGIITGASPTNKIVLTQFAGVAPTTGTLLDRGVFFGGSTYAAYDTNGYVRAYAATDTNAVTSPAAATLGVNDPTKNAFVTGTITNQTNASVNTINDTGAFGITLNASQTLSVNGILKGGNSAATISGGTGINTTASGSELVIRTDQVNDVLTITSPLVANGTNALTKGGAGTLILDGATNGFTGVSTIDAGTLQIGSGSTTGTLGTAAVTNNSNLVFNRSNAYATAAGNVISGAGSLTQAGTGTTTLTAGTSSYAGSTTITNGILSVGTLANGLSNSSIGASSNAASNLVLGGGTLQYTGGSVSTDRNFTLSNATTSGIEVTTAATILTMTGASSATTGALTKLGTGTLVLSGANAHGGDTTISAGTLRLGAADVIPDGAGKGNVVVTGTLDVYGFNETINGLSGGGTVDNLGGGRPILTVGNGDASATFSGVIQGLMSLTKTGSGTETLSGTNKYFDVTSVTGGVLSVNTLADGGSNSAIGASSNYAGNLVLNGGTLKYTGVAVSTDRLFSVGTSGGTIDASGSGALTFSNAGAMDFNGQTGTRTLTLSGSSTALNTLLASIGDNAGATSLVKSGAGTWNMTGANTYTGTTSVNNGTLLLNCTHTGGGLYTVNSGGTLGGGGTTTAAVTILSGGTLSPGNSPGTLTTGGQTWNDGGTYIWQINDINGTQGANPGWDFQSILGGSLNIAASAGTFPTNGFRIDITSLSGASPGSAANFNKYANYTWNIANADGGISNFAANRFDLYQANFSNNIIGGVSNGTFGIQVSGNNLQLTYSHAVDAAPLAAYWTGDASSIWNTYDNSGNTNWSSSPSSNVETHAAPDATSDVYFTIDSGTTNFTNTLGANFSIKSLNFRGTGDATANSVTIGGGNTLTIGSGGIVIESGSAAHFISTAVALGAAQAWANNSTSLLTVSGNVSNGANTLTVNGSGDSTISGAIGSGAGGLTKSGTSTLILSGANSYGGDTTISQGVLKLGTAGVIPNGPGSGNVVFNPVIATTATLNLAGFSETINGLSSSGAGTSVVDNTLASSTATLTVGDADASGTFSGVLQNSGSAAVLKLTKIGAGTQTISGANTYGGDTTISQGVLKLGASGVIPNGPGAGNVVLNPSGGNARLDLAGFNETINGLSSSGAGTSVMDNTLASSTATLTVGDADVGSTFSGVLQNSGSAALLRLTKIGAGTLVLGGGSSNTYGGLTTVTAGELDLGKSGTASAIGGNLLVNTSGTVKYTGGSANQIADGGSVVVSGGTLDIQGDNDTVAGVQLTSGLISGSTGILSSSTDFDVRKGSVTARLGSGVSGVGLSKTTTDTVTLSGANTYNGTTTISDGVLKLAAAGVIPDGSGKGDVSVTGAGKLDLNAFSETINGLSGNGTVDNAAAGTPVFAVGNNNATSTFSGTIKNTLGTLSLTKTGSGKLTLTGANTYQGATDVNAGGELVVDGTHLGAGIADYTVDGTLSGHGTIQALIKGSGLVSPGNSPGILTVTEVDPTSAGGLGFGFEFTALSGVLPTWSNNTASGNDVLRITDGASPFVNGPFNSTNVIDVYFNDGSLSAGDVYIGGFFTDKDSDFLATVLSATYNFWVENPTGSLTFNGNKYNPLATDYPYTGARVSTRRVAGANFASPDAGFGWVTQFTLIETPEPGTLALAAVGLLGFGFVVARRGRRCRA